MLKSVFVVPTRGRPKNAERLLKAWENTKAVADLYFVCGIDDWYLRDYEKIDGINILFNHTTADGAAEPLNFGIRTLLDDSKYDRYDYFGFLGDDNVPRTLYWDYLLRLKLPFGKNGISWGNDLLQEGNLPCHVLTTRAVCEALNGMTPPQNKHCFIDNFWRKLGEDLGELHYSHDVIIEHMHPFARKAEIDEHYVRAYSETFWTHDEKVFKEYITSQAYKDLLARL